MTNSATISNEHSAALPSSSVTPFARVIRALIRAYQYARAGRPSPCRFYPTCSAYAVQALEEHGAAKGLYLAVRRLLRCNPFGPHGVDLVPVPTRRKSV